jgi:hypothetical protein
LNDQEVAPKEFISDMLNKSKMAFMVYNIKMNKRRVLITTSVRKVEMLLESLIFGFKSTGGSVIPTSTYINQYNNYV